MKVPQVALVTQLVDNVAESFTFCLFCPKTRHPLLAHANPLTPLVPVWQLGLAILVGRAPNQVSSASRCFWDKFPANLLYYGAKMRESVPAGGRSCTHVDGVLQRMDAVLPGRGTVRRHVPGICIPPRAGGCQLVHRPQLIFCICPSLLF